MFDVFRDFLWVAILDFLCKVLTCVPVDPIKRESVLVLEPPKAVLSGFVNLDPGPSLLVVVTGHRLVPSRTVPTRT